MNTLCHRSPQHDTARRSAPNGFRLPWAACLLLFGCTFEGYVPKEPPPPPLAESEANIASLEIGELHSAELDCTEGRCRGRYRFVTASPGELTVRVDGPVGEGPEPTGPRIARVVLEGVSQQNLDVVFGSELDEPPIVVSSPVGPGIHYVLIQALGGKVEYTLTSSFEPDASAKESGDALAGSVVMPPAPAPPSLPAPVVPSGEQRTGSDRPGNTSDGADYAYDPTRHDLFRIRSYAFAQDPAAMLRGESGSIQGNAFILRQIQREVRYTLADMQFNQVPPDEAQFLVSLHTGRASERSWFAVNDGIQARPYDSYFQQWRSDGLMLAARTYVDGSLVINFIATQSGELLWQGWTVEAIPLTGSDDKVIKQAVKKVLAQF